MPRFSHYAFDAYGTLFDVHCRGSAQTRGLHQRLFGQDPGSASYRPRGRNAPGLHLVRGRRLWEWLQQRQSQRVGGGDRLAQPL